VVIVGDNNETQQQIFPVIHTKSNLSHIDISVEPDKGKFLHKRYSRGYFSIMGKSLTGITFGEEISLCPWHWHGGISE
jgi:hypothetical protein